MAKAAQPDPKIKIKFQYAENPGKDLEFLYEGKKYHLFDGQEAILPVSVIRHLNSLQYPVYDYVEDRFGGKTVKKTGSRNRFNCIQLKLIQPEKQQDEAVNEQLTP